MSAYQDIPYKCIDCGRPCVWTAKDQAFYAEKGYTNESIAWILDNSCFWQNSKHTKNGKCSADYFKERQYRHEMNQPPAPGSKSGIARNPDIELRVDLINKLLHADPDKDLTPRLMVDPTCTMLIEALKSCKSKKVRHGYGPVGKYAHITDSAGYVAWWAFPKPRGPQKPIGKHYEAVPVEKRQVW